MKYYIGVDFHMQHYSVAVMDREGNVMDEKKLYHSDQKELFNYFSSFDKDTSVALEATRNWYWFVDSLQGIGLDVKLVHAKKARIIAESTIKTDKIDAKALAHLNRCNFLPVAYIADKDVRSLRELLRYYMSLVKIRSSVKNRIHAILAKNNIHHGFSDLFGKAGMLFLNNIDIQAIYRLELNGYLNVLNNLKEQIHQAQLEIKSRCKESNYAKLLITVPGISFFTGLLLSVEIANISRFLTHKKLCCYAGLASSTHQSADKTYHGHIIKDSNKYIRYALIEAVPIAVKKDPKLWLFYTNVMRSKGRTKAKIAVARKLLITIYYMLKFNKEYQINNSRVNSKTKLGTNVALLD